MISQPPFKLKKMGRFKTSIWGKMLRFYVDPCLFCHFPNVEYLGVFIFFSIIYFI